MGIQANSRTTRQAHQTADEMALELFQNVQFIYELALAQLELRAFGIEYELDRSLRRFRLVGDADLETFRRRTAYFSRVAGRESDYAAIVRRNRTRSVNQYLTHWIYPYKGKFHPQMIRALLNILGLRPGDVVLDPFIGSGTTALEAMLLGIDCIGVDISPLCILQSRVKTMAWQVADEIERLAATAQPDDPGGALTLPGLADEAADQSVADFFRMAELVALSDTARRRRDFKSAYAKNLQLMIQSIRDLREVIEDLRLQPGRVALIIGDARRLPLEARSVDGIITSPPYSIALDYVANDAHALSAMGYQLDEIREAFIGVRGRGRKRVELYEEDMSLAYAEMWRVLKPGGQAAIVIGNPVMQGRQIDVVGFTIQTMHDLGFKLSEDIDKVIFGLYNVIQHEHILIFAKPEG